MWVSSAKAITQTFSWLVTIVLARILLPADFGVIAIAWLFIGLLDLITELGVGAAIIQKKDLHQTHLYSTFWLSLLSGIVFYVIIFQCAPFISQFFHNNELTDILRALGTIFLIGSFKTIPLSVLKRDLAFPKTSIAESLSVFIGGLLSITLALEGYGVWSLVFGSISQHLILTCLLFYLSSWKPKLVFHIRKAREILSFGISVAGSSVLWYAHSNADSAIVGRILGDTLLGYYSMAQHLSKMPIGKLMNIINQVAFPVFSRLQDERHSLQAYYLKITRFITLMIFPAMMGLVLVSENLIRVVLTDKWLPILPPFRALCFVSMIKSLDQVIPTVLFAIGKPNIVLRYNFLSLLIIPISFIIGCQYGINGVAYALVFTYPVLSLYYFFQVLTELQVSVSQYIRNLVPSITASSFMVIIVIVFQKGSVFIYDNMYFNLIGSCSVGVIGYFIFLTFCYKDVVNETLDIYYTLRSRGFSTETV